MTGRRREPIELLPSHCAPTTAAAEHHFGGGVFYWTKGNECHRPLEVILLRFPSA